MTTSTTFDKITISSIKQSNESFHLSTIEIKFDLDENLISTIPATATSSLTTSDRTSTSSNIADSFTRFQTDQYITIQHTAINAHVKNDFLARIVNSIVMLANQIHVKTMVIFYLSSYMYKYEQNIFLFMYIGLDRIIFSLKRK